jgi:hypothetical protein
MPDIFHASSLSDEQRDLARLAATRAALDPVRQAYRSDILVSAVIEVLANRGERTTKELVHAVNQIWRTRAITEPEVTDAVTEALSAKLVRRVTDLGNVEKWQRPQERSRIRGRMLNGLSESSPNCSLM